MRNSENSSISVPCKINESSAQRVKINSYFSDWKEIKIGVPNGSVLGLLLFNVLINDIFWFANRTKICNDADNTKIFASHPDLDTIINN